MGATIGGLELADSASASFVGLVAQQSHEGPLNNAVADQLEMTPVGEFAAEAFPAMMEERLGGSHCKEGEGNLGKVVQNIFKAGPFENRLALRAIAGSLWAGERLKQRDPEYTEDPRIHLLGFPGRNGEVIKELLERSEVGFLSDERLEDLLRTAAENEPLDFGKEKWFDIRRRQKIWAAVDQAGRAHFRRQKQLAGDYWSEALTELSKVFFPEKDSVLRAALYWESGSESGWQFAANAFSHAGYLHHAAFAEFKNGDFSEAASAKQQKIEKMEAEAGGVKLILHNSELPEDYQSLMALYRRALLSVPFSSGEARTSLFAEAQEALGRRLANGAVLGNPGNAAPEDIDWSFGYFLGARHLFEAASVYALAGFWISEAEEALDDALDAMRSGSSRPDDIGIRAVGSEGELGRGTTVSF